VSPPNLTVERDCAEAGFLKFGCSVSVPIFILQFSGGASAHFYVRGFPLRAVVHQLRAFRQCVNPAINSIVRVAHIVFTRFAAFPCWVHPASLLMLHHALFAHHGAMPAPVFAKVSCRFSWHQNPLTLRSSGAPEAWFSVDKSIRARSTTR
jgi:hypothetical protein